jgi:methionyl-tRNA synthetase
MTGHRLTHGLAHAARRTTVLAAIGILPFMICGAAYATNCSDEIGAISQKRQTIMDQLNKLAKGTQNQLDPVASCPKLRALVAAERQLVAYLTKNKDWCAVPDDALQNISATAAKSGEIANQACTIAAQMKKAQEQQATGLNGPQGQKLPTGPL